jgi:hypothetical protein
MRHATVFGYANGRRQPWDAPCSRPKHRLCRECRNSAIQSTWSNRRRLSTRGSCSSIYDPRRPLIWKPANDRCLADNPDDWSAASRWMRARSQVRRDSLFKPAKTSFVTSEATEANCQRLPEGMSDRDAVSRTRGRERHRDPIHAVAKTSRFRAILEHVAQMSTTAMAMNLRPRHPK